MLMYDSPMLDSFRYECTLLEHVRVPDGMGGSTMAWTDGMKFDMVFERDASTQALIAAHIPGLHAEDDGPEIP